MPNPSQVAAWLRQNARRMPSTLDTAVRDWARWSYGIALSYSSGRVRQEVFDTPLGGTVAPSGKKLTLHRSGSTTGLGHPYGHGPVGSLGPRGPIPYGDPAKINVQSSDFFRSWQVRRGFNHSWLLINDSDHARELVDGTTRMIRRPILDRIVTAAEGRARFFGLQALNGLFN